MDNTKDVARVIPKPKGKRGFVQGFFIPKNKEKYTGDLSKIFFRSSFEIALMRRLDDNPNVLRWLSESKSIPYFSTADNKMRNYFIDFFVTVLKEDGTQENIAIEIKPHSQTVKPKKGKRKREAVYLRECYDYQVNQDKWKFATLWCEKHNFTFKVMDEYHLGLKIRK